MKCKKCDMEIKDKIEHIKDFHSNIYQSLVMDLQDLSIIKNEIDRIDKEKTIIKARVSKLEQDINDSIHRILWQ